MPAMYDWDFPKKPRYWGHEPRRNDPETCADCGADLTDLGAGLKIPNHKGRWSSEEKR